MIALDLSQTHDHVLLIIYLKFTAKGVEGVEKEKNLDQCAISEVLKIRNYIMKAAYVKKDGWHPLVG